MTPDQWVSAMPAVAVARRGLGGDVHVGENAARSVDDDGPERALDREAAAAPVETCRGGEKDTAANAGGLVWSERG